MSNKQLSKNFSLDEFTYSAAAKKRITPTDFQIEMLKLLCKNLLQPIRDKFGPMKITSGIRDREIYHALIKAGYPASKTSDHFLVPNLVKTEAGWLAPVGSPNPRGKGAADFIMLQADVWDTYYWILDNFKASHDYNQVIIYTSEYSDRRGNYMHISNPARLFIAKSIIPSRRPTMVYVKSNKKFIGKSYVTLDEFQDTLGDNFKQRR